MGIKCIGILISGGDCFGFNVVIWVVVKVLVFKGWEVYGIFYGIDGFVEVVYGKY